MDSSKDINPSDQGSDKAAPATGSTSPADAPSEAVQSAASVDSKAAETAGAPVEKASYEAAPEPAISAARSESGADAAKESAAVKAPGSSLILLSPVTRKTEGAQSDALHMANSNASAASFTAARAGKRQSFNKNWLRYGVPAALGFCLFGFGVATGGQFFGTAVPPHSATAAATSAGVAGAKVARASADQIEMRRLTKKLGDEIHTLQTRVESLRVAAQATSPEDVRSMKKSLDGLRASVESVKAETSSSIAQLNTKVERLQREEAKLQQPGEKLSRNEHSASTGPLTTGSIARSATPHNVQTASAQAGTASLKGHAPAMSATAEAKKKPKLLVDWVVRDVYRGVALIDGPEGTIEVARGDPIPGAGTVESIERKNGGWVLITSRGIVGSVRE